MVHQLSWTVHDYELVVVFRQPDSEFTNSLTSLFKNVELAQMLDAIDQYAFLSECVRVELYLVLDNATWVIHEEDILHDGKRPQPTQLRHQNKDYIVAHDLGLINVRLSGNMGQLGGSVPVNATVRINTD